MRHLCHVKAFTPTISPHSFLPALLAALLLASPAPAAPTIFYVSPSGNDAFSGRLAAPALDRPGGPFATINRAREAIREHKASHDPGDGYVVELAPGRYELTAPIELTAEDSGTTSAPIIYCAESDQRVVISGGRQITDWQPVTDPTVLERLTPAARDHVRQTNLKALGIDDFGDLGLDAEWKIQTWLAGKHVQGEYTMGASQASRGKNVRPRMELFFDDEPMQIARGPNEDDLIIEETLGQTERNVRGHISSVEGIFRYRGDYPKRWVGEKDGWVCGSWCRDWAEQRHKIESLDPQSRVISVEKPYHYYGYHKGQWFYGFNMLVELDRPGEWYADRETGILYFWPPAPLEDATAELSMAPRLFVLGGASHVTIRGLVLEATRGTAVAMEDCDHCRVVACTCRNLGNHGVTIFGGTECGVVGCDMYGLGGGGIYLVGGDRKQLTPGGHYAENNHIEHYARWDRMYRPAVMISGVGNRVSHNLIHDAPHSAIVFGGNEHVIEMNDIHNVCHQSHDCGAIYAGRSWTLRGHVIRNNYLHHLYGKHGGPCNGIYLDDLFSSAVVEGNVFYQVLRPVFLGGGRDNLVQNNIFVDCPKAMHIDARALGWCGPHADGRIKEATEKGTIAGDRFAEPPFSTRYPKLLELLGDEPKKPKGNIVRRNIFWKGDAENLRRVAAGKPIPDTWWDDIAPNIRSLVTLEDNLINQDPHFVNEWTADFELRDDSPAWKLGFQKIPVREIGLFPSEDRASWVIGNPVRVLRAWPYRKVLFLGNSITRHGPSKAVDWSGNWGMAASSEESDFVHLVTKGLTERMGPAPEIRIENIAAFERGYADYDVPGMLKQYTAFAPDLVIVAIGENVPALSSPEASSKFAESLGKLLNGLKASNNPTILVRSCFWANEPKDKVLHEVCDDVGGIFVDIHELADDEFNYARSERQFTHAGVAAHPGDAGMKAIAYAILEALDQQ